MEKRQQEAGQLVDRQGHNVLRIQPERLGVDGIRFGEVHHRVAAIDALEGEGVDEILAGHALAVVLRRPAEQAQKIQIGVRQEARVAVRGDAHHGPMAALGELGAVGRNQQREVRENGRGDAGGLEDQNVFEGVGEVVLAADDMADAEIDVVGTGGHVVGGQAVAAQQGEVFDIGGRLGLLAIDSIAEGDGVDRVARHAEAQHEGFAGGGAAIAFLARELAHAGMVEPGGAFAGLVLDLGLDRREIAIGQTLGEDGFGHLAVQRQAFGLAVLLIPGEIEPAEAVEDGILGLLRVAPGVCVVDAQDHGPVVVPGIQPVENEGPRTADVEVAGRRGSKSDSEHGNSSISRTGEVNLLPLGAQAGEHGAQITDAAHRDDDGDDREGGARHHEVDDPKVVPIFHVRLNRSIALP